MTDYTAEEVAYFDAVRKGQESLAQMSDAERPRYEAWLKSNGYVATTVVRGSSVKPKQEVFNEYNANKCKIPITDLTEEEIGMFFMGFYPIKYSAPDEKGHRDKIQDTATWLKFRPDFKPTEENDHLGWSQHNYLLTWEEAKTCDGFNGVIRDGFACLDFDKRDSVKEPQFKGKESVDSTMFVRLVNRSHLNTLVVRTNNGLHAYFRNDAQDIKSSTGVFTPMNMKVDYRANGRASVCLKINGEPRVVIYKPQKSQTQPIKIDDIPIYLKECTKYPLLDEKYWFPLHLEDLTEREVTFRNYLLKLINLGYKDKEIADIIFAINRCLTNPLMERELTDKLLSPAKLKGSRKAAKQVTERKPEEYLKKGQEEFIASAAQGVCEREIARAVKKFNSIHTDEKFVGVKKNRGVYEIIVGDNDTYHEFPLTASSLSGIVTTEEFYWTNGKINDDGTHEYAVPNHTAFKGLVESLGYNSNLPMYQRVFSGAFLTQDGRVVNKRGLDEETGVYLLNNIEVPDIPENPTWDDVVAVKDMFAKIFRDFQFEGINDEADNLDENVNYNNLILALALAVFRMSIKGAYPIICINKSSERSGASLLCSVISRLAHNREVDSLSLAEENVQEAEKQINSVILQNSPMTVLDNVTNRTKTNFSSLLSVSSGDGTFKVRPLGSSFSVDCEKNIMLLMNGIKISVSADLTPRVVLITLALKSSWQRAQFTRSKMQVLDLATKMHPMAIYGIGVFLNYWKSQGAPKMPSVGVNLSEYLDLYNFVGSILYTCGYTNILKNSLEIATTENEKDSNGTRFVEIFEKKLGLGEVSLDKIISTCLNERLERSQSSSGVGCYGSRQNYRFSEDLMTLLVSSKEVKDMENIDSSVWGRRVGKFVDIVFDGATKVLKRKRNKDGTLYYLVDVKEVTK